MQTGLDLLKSDCIPVILYPSPTVLNKHPFNMYIYFYVNVLLKNVPCCFVYFSFRWHSIVLFPALFTCCKMLHRVPAPRFTCPRAGGWGPGVRLPAATMLPSPAMDIPRMDLGGSVPRLSAQLISEPEGTYLIWLCNAKRLSGRNTVFRFFLYCASHARVCYQLC